MFVAIIKEPAFPGQGQKRPAGPVRRGAINTVELAVVAPVFFLLVLGIIEVGRAFMVTHLLNNAARTGCRVGIIEGINSATIDTAVDNVLAAQGIPSKNVTVTVKVNGVSADASTAQSGDQLTVVVSVSAAQMTWLPVPKYMTGNLTGEYALRRE